MAPLSPALYAGTTGCVGMSSCDLRICAFDQRSSLRKLVTAPVFRCWWTSVNVAPGISAPTAEKSLSGRAFRSIVEWICSRACISALRLKISGEFTNGSSDFLLNTLRDTRNIGVKAECFRKKFGADQCYAHYNRGKSASSRVDFQGFFAAGVAPACSFCSFGGRTFTL